MNDAVLIPMAAVMLFLFIKDSPITKKLWAVVVTAVSVSAVIYAVIVYYDFIADINKSAVGYKLKTKWMSDFDVYIACIIVLSLITALIFLFGYYRIKRQKDNDNFDGFVEYLIIGAALVVAIVIYVTGTSFALTHMSKYFDVSFYPTAVSSAMTGTIVANVLLYMKILQ